uniref:FKBP-type peptidyl-prolyl cis-trans isomerase n=1 Tax=Lutibacter sp. TaxID=1925666 RepID=UPI00356786D8
MKFKNLFFILAIALVIFSCKNDNNDATSTDPAAQSLLDDEALIEYLQTHYLNEDDGGLWTITNGETPIMDDDRLAVQDIIKDDIAYKLYYLKEQEGITISPSRADSVLTTYTGMLLDSTVFDSRSSVVWFSLTNVIDGWGYGFTNFKGGTKFINDDESFYYTDSGKGILFIPSGLGYGSFGNGFIPGNAPLIFQITLDAVNESDDDHDGILSKNEDLDNDGNVKNDDTDGDGIMNYLDSDDDGDGILTK